MRGCRGDMGGMGRRPVGHGAGRGGAAGRDGGACWDEGSKREVEREGQGWAFLDRAQLFVIR